MAERSIASVCKTDAFGLRRFESCPTHRVKKILHSKNFPRGLTRDVVLRGRHVIREKRILRATKIMFYVYLLESLNDRSWYIGYSADLKKRFTSHNKGENAATRIKKPWKLIYYEAYLDRIDAKKRERFLKSGSGRKFLRRQLNNYINTN